MNPIKKAYRELLHLIWWELHGYNQARAWDQGFGAGQHYVEQHGRPEGVWGGHLDWTYSSPEPVNPFASERKRGLSR